MRHFKKQNPKQPLYGSHGQWISFPDFGNGWGGLSTESPKLIKEFELAIQKSVGGVTEVSEKELEDLKKKPLAVPFREEILPAHLRKHPKSRNSVIVRQHGVADGHSKSRDFTVQTRGGLLMPNLPASPSGFRPASVRSR